MADNKRIVLAYSGGLDTSVAISYLKERTGCDDTVACDGDRQLAGGIDAVLGGKNVLGADDPIDMLHGHPHLWQEIQHPRVYSPALATKPQAANH